MHHNKEKIVVRRENLVYWGNQTITVIKEIENMLKEYYGEEDYLFLRKVIMQLMSLKGRAWHNTLHMRKGAYESAMRLKQEVEKRVRGMDV